MKKFLLLTFIVAAAGTCQAQQFTARVPRRPAPAVQAPASEGAIQRGVRLGNPAQLINPFAPREYGNGREFVYEEDYDSTVTGGARRTRPVGLRLFSFAF